MRVLITGAAGHVGRRLAKEFPGSALLDIAAGTGDKLGGQYASIDIDDARALAREMHRSAPSVVIHLAARVGRVVAEKSPACTLKLNVNGTHNVAAICADYGYPLIHVSTSEVYGPLAGPNADGFTSCLPNNWYGRTKLLGEDVVRHYAAFKALHACIVRPFMMYHESETQGSHRSAMIRFAQAVRDGEEIELHKGAARGWLHFDDVAAFFRILVEMDKDDWPAILNIGNPDTIPMSELIAMMAAEYKTEPKVREVEQPGGMTLVKSPDLSTQERLGMVPQVSNRRGVQRVCGYLRSSPEVRTAIDEVCGYLLAAPGEMTDKRIRNQVEHWRKKYGIVKPVYPVEEA